MITLDRQVVSGRCEACKAEFTVVRGSAFDDGEPFGLYLIALHGHAPEGRLAHLALGLRDQAQPDATPTAVAIRVLANAQEFQQTLVDWQDSPWATEAYLGCMLGRADALLSPVKDLAFHVADHVIREVPEVQAYLA